MQRRCLGTSLEPREALAALATRRSAAVRSRLARFVSLLLALAGAVASSPIVRAATPAPLPPIRHVWVVVLENEGFDASFTNNPHPFLAKQLPSLGVLLTQYYAIGHASLDNYIAMISGQGPAIDTQADCPIYQDVVPGTPAPTGGGQVLASVGCVYPASVLTLADQLDAAGLTWKGYMEDLGNDPARDSPTTCTDPTPPRQDRTQTAEAQDMYATRHDPFMYFHSIIDSPTCRTRIVNFASPTAGLLHDLQSVATTPNFSFVTPNLCNDGHDAPCVNGDPGGLASIDSWLARYIPAILASPAFRSDGMLVVTFDEASNADTSSCCNEPMSPNSPAAGGPNGGTGGGRVGAVVVSPFVRPGTTSSVPYNHYSLLRTLEDVFGLRTGGSDGKGHLGFAGASDLARFGADVFGGSGLLGAASPGASSVAGTTTPATATAPLPSTASTPPGAAGAAAFLGAALAGAVGRRQRQRPA